MHRLYPADPHSVLVGLRDLLSRNPEAACRGPEALQELLYAGRFVPRRPTMHEVEAALDALRVEGEVVA